MKCFITLLGAFLLVAPLQASIITIPDNAFTIQAGIDMASILDTVFVKVGTYNEYLSIDKQITLLGQAMNCTFITGNDTGTVIQITSPGVIVRKFTVSGSGAFHESEMPWDAAIKITEADNCIIESCQLINNGGAGIALSESSYCIFRHNQIRNNYSGIYFYESPDYPEIDNTQNLIEYNHITDNDQIGIKLEHALAAHHRGNVITCNEISRNGNGGLWMIMSYNDTIAYNQFSFNLYCFSYMECSGGGGNNLFHHNIFQSPDENSAVHYCEDYMGYNYWTQPDTCVGNYWANYTGTDSNGDGIGDSEYGVGEYPEIDWCPLMSYADSDGDGVADYVDNCPNIANPDQSDMNGDGIGDVCDAFVCGDANGDKLINIGDAVSIISYVFRDGSAPEPEMAGNANCDGSCNVGDAVYLISYIFRGGPPPCCQ